jgi:hypothetical protein
MRLDRANSGLETYLNQEAYLNNLKRVSINSGTEYALAIALVDSSGNQIIPIASSGTLGDGRQVVTTAGTRVQLSAASVSCSRVTIIAETDNTDYVVVGAVTVVAALATRRGSPLGPGDSMTLNVNNLNLVYIDSLVSTEGVTFVYE